MTCLLFIGHLWPEPASSAAGYRTLALLKALSGQYQIHFACAAEQTQYCARLETLNIESHSISLNDASFDQFIQKLQPELVFYDRFITEEQFAPRVQEHCPQAINILDTQDLHFLRRARQNALNKNQPVDIYTDDAIREIAAILRSDLSLIISSYEMQLLLDAFNISTDIIHYCPFMLEQTVTQSTALKDYSEREHFVMIGNFLHPPNWDAVQWTYQHIWPKIKQALPDTELHIYGAYPSEKVMQLHKPEKGFFIKGRADHAINTLANYRVNLAPLRFGAGIKGKIADGFLAGTPCVTTPIGREGMADNMPWGGRVSTSSDNAGEIIEQAIGLYNDPDLWQQYQNNGLKIIQQQFDYQQHAQQLVERIKNLEDTITSHRKKNFYGKILRHNLYRSQYYMSKWIEEKNKYNDSA